MSLNEVSLFYIVKKQVNFKIKSYTGIFHSLIVLQVLGMFLSTLGDSSMYSETSPGNSISVHYINSRVIVGMTAAWLFINTLILTTKAYREDDFTYVSSRWSRLLANICFLLILALIGSVTSFLATNVMTIYLALGNKELIVTTSLSIFSVFLGIIGVLGYFVLVSSIAYVIGSIIQRNILYGIGTSLIYILVGIMVMWLNSSVVQIIYFFTKESNVIFYLLKVIFTSSLLYGLSWLMSKNQEVRT